jgi:hypothetical protein
MNKYTKKSHLKNHYENGRQEPWVLLESFTKDGKFIEYTSNYISAAVNEYDGNIPDAKDIPVLVWHSSESVQDPVNYLPREIPEVETTTLTKDEQTALEDKVKEWSDENVNSSNYTNKRSEFIIENTENITPYCTSLLTCTCGKRKVFESVSEAFAYQQLDHLDNEHESLLWYYCGSIDKDTREYSRSVYEGSKADHTGLLDKIMNRKANKEPIRLVPIHETPLSIALQEIEAYKVTSYSTEEPPKPTDDSTEQNKEVQDRK